jgi:hypothetical protein
MSNPISVPALVNQVDELRAEGHDNAAIERDISRYLQEQDLTQEEILEKTRSSLRPRNAALSKLNLRANSLRTGSARKPQLAPRHLLPPHQGPPTQRSSWMSMPGQRTLGSLPNSQP